MLEVNQSNALDEQEVFRDLCGLQIITHSEAWIQFMNEDTEYFSVWSFSALFDSSYQITTVISSLRFQDDMHFLFLKYFLTLWTLSFKFFRDWLNVVTLIHRSLQQLWRFHCTCKCSSNRFCSVTLINKQWHESSIEDASLSLLLQHIQSLLWKDDINFRLLKYFLTFWTLSFKLFRNSSNVVTFNHQSLQQL